MDITDDDIEAAMMGEYITMDKVEQKGYLEWQGSLESYTKEQIILGYIDDGGWTHCDGINGPTSPPPPPIKPVEDAPLAEKMFKFL